METSTGVVIHQHNDWEVLAFFNANRVDYTLIGDHLFIVHGRTGDMRAGPGDLVSAVVGGDVSVRHGNHSVRAHRAINQARLVRRGRERALRAQAAQATG